MTANDPKDTPVGFTIAGFTSLDPDHLSYYQRPATGWFSRRFRRGTPKPAPPVRKEPPLPPTHFYPGPTGSGGYAGILDQTRILYGDQLEPGMIIIERCLGKYCHSATTHKLLDAHHLTILELRDIRYGYVGITIDEDGNQQALDISKRGTIRVLTR